MKPPARPQASGATQSALRDLLTTHESSPAPLEGPAWHRRSDGLQPRSLFVEILDWMLAPLLLLWPLSVAITFIVARSLADEPFDRALVDHARVIAEETRTYLKGGPLPENRALGNLLPGLQSGDMSYQIIANDGEMLRGDAAMPPPALYDFPEPGRVKLRTDLLEGDEVRIAYVHLITDEAEGAEPLLLVQIAEKLGSREALANQIIRGIIFPQFVILPIAALLVWLGLMRGLRPLARVRERLHDRGSDDLSPIDPASVPAEIVPMVDAFNELLGRLDDRVGAQKRFLADAAHQMKTPLAGLRMQAELALRERDPASLRRSLEQIAIGSDRAARLIGQLLSLARTENQRAIAHFEELDLAMLARETVAEWAPAALARRADFGFEHDGQPAPIRGSPVLLRELLGNLIDNALRYTPHGGRITVRLRREAAQAILEVEDSGPGIAAADRALVFERFFRVMGAPGDGSGLGLAIVKEIAEQHGATVAVGGAEPREPHLEGAGAPAATTTPDAAAAIADPPGGASVSSPGVGALFTVRFPCAETAPAPRSAARFDSPRGLGL
jgi:two-component system sensor histidine kinase TctE